MALTAVVSLEPVLHEANGHDTDCDPAIVIHDASQHRIGGAPTGDKAPPGADHCVVCHLFRHSQNAGVRSSVIDAPLRVALKAGAENRTRLSAGAALALPARAPPALT